MSTPWSGDGDKFWDEVHTLLTDSFADGFVGYQSAHAMSHHVALGKAVTFLQNFQAGGQAFRNPAQSHAAGIVIEPELKMRMIKVIHEIAPVLRTAANPIDQNHRYSLGIIGFCKENTSRVLVEKVKGSPHPDAAGRTRKSWIVQ